MRKKKQVKLTKQLNVRVSERTYQRVEALAFRQDIDPSDVVCIILAEHIDEHEKRLKITPGQAEPTETQ